MITISGYGRRQKERDYTRACATHICSTRLSGSRWWCVTKLGQTQLIFVDPAVKINDAYYTVMCFSLNSYCLSCRRSRDSSSSCSRTVLQRISHATQSNFLNGRHPRSLHQTCGPQTVQILTQWTTRCGSHFSWCAPTLMQRDFLTLIDVSIESSSCSHAHENFCNTVTDGACIKMSSA